MTRHRQGVTLVELLVVIAVIGLLVALLIPAVQAAREAARRGQCMNNLRQQSVAMLAHEAAYQHLPPNGWGFMWMGDPDRGSGKNQPGGWIYLLLPYLDQQALREMGKKQPPAAKAATLATLAQTPLPSFVCPSRRRGEPFPFDTRFIPRNCGPLTLGAKTDYAVCEGDYITDTIASPMTLAQGDDPRYRWKDVSRATGICFLRSQVRMAQIEDGTTQTYMIGEKYVDAAEYETGKDLGDDQTLYLGVDWDINRWGTEALTPLRDERGRPEPRRFGSAHAPGCHMAFCDGSVRLVGYSIDPLLHRRLANRRDHAVVEMEKIP